MHALLAFSALGLAILAGVLALRGLPRLIDWDGRRHIQLLVLAAPVLSLAIGLGAMFHFTGHICFIDAPPWDYTLGLAVPLGMAAVALGGLALGLMRLALMSRLFAQRGIPAQPELQALAERLAAYLGAPRPRVLLVALERPLALASGLRQPSILLSTWTLDHLDRQELEAVLAHELGHIARRDYLAVWLATVLRDAFCYLPTSWAAHRQLQQEKELACDDLAVQITGRPLALASALTKVWHPALTRSSVSLAQPFAGRSGSIEGRIERLLTRPALAPDQSIPSSETDRQRGRAVAIAGSALAMLIAVQGANAIALLAPMGCGPAAALAKLL